MRFGFHLSGLTYHLQNRLLHELPERVVGMLFPQVMHQLGKDLSVRVRLEFVALLRQEGLHVVVVGNDAIVDDDKAVALIRTLRMRVTLTGHAVGGPTCMCNANVSLHRLTVLRAVEVCTRAIQLD